MATYRTLRYRIAALYRSHGLLGLLQRAGQSSYIATFRRLMPKTGERVRLAELIGPEALRVGDLALSSVFPHLGHRPRYEARLVDALRRHLKPGDRVAIVGGGHGVTAALAASLVGPNGSVVCFEGSRAAAEVVRQTAERNGVIVDVRESVVGKNVGVYGTASTAVTAPADLEECDVLELDCEGAEALILGELRIRPRVIIVETHGFLGSPSAGIFSLLLSMGYDVADMGEAEPDLLDFCRRSDIRVLEAMRKQ